MMKLKLIILFAVLMIALSSCLPPPDDFDNPQDPTIEDPELATANVTKITASSHDGNVPENVLDDNLSTRWSASGHGQYITLELNESIFIDNIGIAWYLGDERYANYEIQTSTNTIDWITAINSTTDELTLEHHKDNISANASHIRIIGYGNNQSNWNSITSIHINGKNPEYVPEDNLLNRTFSLRGNPNFDINQLTQEQRVHYEKILEELDNADNRKRIKDIMDRDDLYFHSRIVHGYIQSIITVFRITGDLRLLDRIDEITEDMKLQLDYGWRGTQDGTDGTWDDYLMWVYRSSSASGYDNINDGKDRKIDDLKVNALIAMVAHTLEENRDLESPNGRDYAAHADFWKDYLLNHFEAKYRDKTNRLTGHPITTPHPDAHSYWSWIKANYYMWKITGDSGWLNEANRASDIVWTHEIRDVAEYDNEPFSAYVWMSNIHHESTSRNYLQTTSYANSIYGDIIDFHMEGFNRWADEREMVKFARSVTEFHFRKADGSKYSSPSDVLSNGIAGDIGGNSANYKVPRAGIPVNSNEGRPVRRTAAVFSQYKMFLISPWDSSNLIADVGKSIQQNNPSLDTMHISAGLFLNSYIKEE